MIARRQHRQQWLTLLVIVAGSLTACSSSGHGAQAGATGTAGTKSICTGKPLQFTRIDSLTGSLNIPGTSIETKDATTAALQAVNHQCALGRPIAVDICDDRSDPNVAQQCGLEAKRNRSLALFGSSGAFDNGTTTAQLPGVFTDGSTLFDLSNPDSFSSSSGLTLVFGAASIAAGLGKKQMLLVAVDTSATRAFASIAQTVAKDEGLRMDLLFVPATTTDYESIAAQVSESKPQSIGIAVANPVPFMNALATEGITPKTIPMLTAVTLLPPEVLHQLGRLADGTYMLTQQAPPSDIENPGIRQMLSELKEAGFNADGLDLSPASTGAWSDVHALVSVLERLPRVEIKTLNTAELVKAMEMAGPIDQPEVAPFDFGKLAFPDISALASFRFFSRDAMVIRVVNGHYQSDSSFRDVTRPFILGS